MKHPMCNSIRPAAVVRSQDQMAMLPTAWTVDTSLEWAKTKKEKKRKSLDAQRPPDNSDQVTSQDEACGARTL